MPPRTVPSRVVLPPSEQDARRIKRSRVVSFVLVAIAAVVLSLRPEVFGDPQGQPLHALLHVWRVVLGIALGVAALAVQVTVGVQWRQDLRQRADATDGDSDKDNHNDNDSGGGSNNKQDDNA